MTRNVPVHARISQELKDLAHVCAQRKGLKDSSFYALAIEEAVRKYRPRHKIAEPEFVETEDIREAFAQDLQRMDVFP